ncbi:MAG: hypothetical protein IM574_10695 [Cytophagales bacterium]|nr:hypothetical protein [Cytophagales bacterium]
MTKQHQQQTEKCPVNMDLVLMKIERGSVLRRARSIGMVNHPPIVDSASIPIFIGMVNVATFAKPEMVNDSNGPLQISSCSENLQNSICYLRAFIKLL